MLALALTFTVIVFILGPDLLSRWVLGFLVPRRSLSQNKGEEVTRAILWAALPLALTILWVRLSGALGLWGNWEDVRFVLSGLYSTTFFDTHNQMFFCSFPKVAGMYWSLVWRLYLIVSLISILLNFAILNFRRLRYSLKSARAKTILATFVLPRISEWHVLLSDMLLPKEDVTLAVDVLTKSGTLYQGGVQDRMLGSDGSLQSLTLSDPRRFLREDFRKAKEAGLNTKQDTFWRSIPGKLFVILGSDIASVNVRYPPRVALVRRELSEAELDAVRDLLAKLTRPQESTSVALSVQDPQEPLA